MSSRMIGWMRKPVDIPYGEAAVDKRSVYDDID